MAATTHRYDELVVACKSDSLNDIGVGRAPYDQCRVAVDHAVPDRPHFIILSGVRSKNLTFKGSFQSFDDVLLDSCLATCENVSLQIWHALLLFSTLWILGRLGCRGEGSLLETLSRLLNCSGQA